LKVIFAMVRITDEHGQELRKVSGMHDLDLVRAAAEDVASARLVLSHRIEALEIIVKAALEHGAPMAQVLEASEPSKPLASSVGPVLAS
jgi:hypothetical protein